MWARGIGGWATATALCLAGCAVHEYENPGVDPASDAGTAPASDAGTAPASDAGTAPASDAGTADVQVHDTGAADVPVILRGPTPCLESRDPDLYPIRQLDPDADGGVDDSDEPSVALVIFDKSGSMSSSWAEEGELDGGPVGTKWDAASDALIGAVTPVQHRVTLGAIFFPKPNECLVAPIDGEGQVFFRPGPEFITTWEQVAPLNQPNGATPLEAAFVVAEQAIEAACTDGLLDGRFFVMVLTDGMPNCEVDMAVVEAVAAKWLAHGVPTYVFGLPGSEDASDVLDRIATAGGTQTLVVPGSPAALEEDMATLM